MSNYKPRPQNRREFLDTLVMPYDQNMGNPNEILSEPLVPGTPEINRALQMSHKNEDSKKFSIGLQDNDETIQYYFDNVIKPSVYNNGSQLKVPVIYGSPENWKSVQADGFYRDKTGKLMVPLIMYKRSTIEKNRDLGNKLDGNLVHNVQLFEKRYTKRNIYDNFSVLRGQLPEKEFVVGVIPDYVTITYNCIVFTDFVEQMNKIVEAIEFASDSYWGDPNKFNFRARINSFSTVTEVANDTDRAVKTNFDIILSGYLVPDTINRYKANTDLAYGITKVIINGETVLSGLGSATPSTVNIVGQGSTNVLISQTTGVDQATIDYLNTNIQHDADTITANTAVFTGRNFASAPAALPATSATNFTVFINGQFAPAGSVTSITNGPVTVTFNTTILGYTLKSTDIITLIGKFSS
jgi:hypothetical protein